MTTGEYLSSNAGISYPFKQDQDIPEQVTRLFADARICSDSGSASLTHAKYELGSGIFKFTVLGNEYSVSDSGNAVYVVAGNDLCAFVIDREYLSTLTDFEFTGSAVFEESCIDVPEECLRSIEIYNGEDDPRNAIVAGNVLLSGGYNVELSDSSEQISISASPGSGLGTVPCEDICDEDMTVSGESLSSDDGNIVITGDSCYDVQASGNKIQIYGKCVACCQCYDYIDVVSVLKETAERIESTKKDLTKSKTDSYFDIIHKKTTLQGGAPDLSIQVDIVPDATIAGFAKDKDREAFDLDGFQAIRVNVVVTNMCGVPCFIAAPCAVTAEKIETYDNDPRWLNITNYKYIDGKNVKKITDICNNGVVCFVDLLSGASGSGVVLPSFLHRENDNGWTEYSSIRGPAYGRNKTGKSLAPPDISSSRDYFSRVRADAASSLSNIENLAIRDLNSGKNPSNQLSYARSVSVSECPSYGNGVNSSVGHLAAPGESFTVSNVYAVPGSFFAERKNRMLAAHFTCSAFAPMLAYSYAYNFAVSRVSDSTSEGSVRWVAGKTHPTVNTVFRTFSISALYDVASGTRTWIT